MPDIADIVHVAKHVAGAGLAFAVGVPIHGIFARWRATYQPKTAAIRLEGDDTEGGDQSPEPERVRNVFQMFGRVCRKEGLAGLYKGTIPAIGIAIFTALYSHFSVRHFGNDHSPNMFVNVLIHTAFHILIAILVLPLLVLYVRAVVTSTRLGFTTHPVRAIRTLYTATERANPFLVYLTPGLWLAIFLQETFTRELLGRRFNRLTRGYGEDGQIEVWRLLVADLILTLAFLGLPPLQVATTKLCLQRTGETAEEEEVEAVEQYSGEEVVGLRFEPYTSLLDCLHKVHREEGLLVLFRLWWVNAISVVHLSGLGHWAFHKVRKSH